jgi:IS5 family transposase
MITYTPEGQLSLDMFKTPFDTVLDQDNRWVKLSKIVPWDRLANIYCQKLDNNSGRKSVDVRLVIGALIVKHKLNLDDRGTVTMIQENMYIQYFCGYRTFNPGKPFDPSLFVDIRKRMGNKEFDAFNRIVIESFEEKKPKRSRIIAPEDRSDTTDQGGPSSAAKPNKGKLKLDATVADQEITYPTDLKLLNTSREELERLIDIMHDVVVHGEKPRTYRRVARKSYLNMAKNKNKGAKLIRKGTKAQLQFVKRNLGISDRLYDVLKKRKLDKLILEKKDRELLKTIHEVYLQQLQMYKEKSHSCPNRIVNIHQPWVRPMPRGKDGSRTEFGAKINISEVEGFCRINRVGWDNYNESVDLESQVEAYRQLYGRYPKIVLADQIYLNRCNRNYMKNKDIEIIGKPLGRPLKTKQTSQQKWKKKKLAAQRNHVEGKFGQGKRGYGLNNIKARLSETSESWIGAIFFVMNLTRLLKMAEKAAHFYAHILKAIKSNNILIFFPRMVTQFKILKLKPC